MLATDSFWYFGPLKDMAWTEHEFESPDVLQIMMAIKKPAPPPPRIEITEKLTETFH